MRIVAITAIATMLLAPVSYAQPPAELLLGEWHCSAPAEDLVSAGPVVYLADGTSTFDQVVTGKVEGMDVMVRVVGSGTWEIEDNGQLTDRILKAEAVEGTIGGGPLPKDVLGVFETEVVANGLSTSDFTVSASELMISDGEGGGSTCKR